MKKIITAFCLVALALTGCAAEPAQFPTQTPASVPHPTDKDDLYVEAFLLTIRLEYPEAYDMSDRELIEMGDSICGLLDSGAVGTPQALGVLLMAGNPNLDATTVGYLIGASVAAFCPEHR